MKTSLGFQVKLTPFPLNFYNLLSTALFRAQIAPFLLGIHPLFFLFEGTDLPSHGAWYKVGSQNTGSEQMEPHGTPLPVSRMGVQAPKGPQGL